MKYIEDLREGDNFSEVYLCKKADALTSKNGKTYYSLQLQDKTGLVDGKIWDVASPGIEDFDKGDFVKVDGRVTSFQGNLQLNIDRIYRVSEGQYQMSDYMPCSEHNVDEMFAEMMGYLKSVKNPHLKALINAFFENETYVNLFKTHSAAKSVHHGYIGGLLEHTLQVVKLCDCYCTMFPELKRDLLLTADALHDIGKIKELSKFPENDYTDDGQLLGHIVMGIISIDKAIDGIEGFPHVLRAEVEHLIAAHHGELEYGSPKKPALMEAVALHYADNTSAKLQTFKEATKKANGTEWLGYQRFFESNIRKTSDGE